MKLQNFIANVAYQIRHLEFSPDLITDNQVYENKIDFTYGEYGIFTINKNDITTFEERH